MGIAIISGVLASLDSRSPLHGQTSGQPKWESHTPGTATPTNIADDDPSLPSGFIACVRREESAKSLREKFRAVVGGDAVQVTVGQNVSAVQQSDVVLLWFVRVHVNKSICRIGLIPFSLPLIQLQAAVGAPHPP